MKPKPGKRRAARGASPWRAALCLALACLCLAACRPRGGAPSLPRPQPGYTAWLERQSMAAQADQLIAQVSQTGRIWMLPGSGAPVEALLRAAPQWLELDAGDLPGGGFLSGLARGIPGLRASGVKGLYLGPLGDGQAHWRPGGAESAPGLPASLELDPRLGGAQDFERLAEAAEAAGMELGADLLGAATAMGPDFFLQARKAPGHAGLYAMLELPGNLWPEAPPASSEWDGAALPAAQAASLAAQGALPQALRRDARPWGPPAGWAATGEVMGTDGKLRRWLYRYEGDPASPVLLWQDPAGLARKIFSAAVIQHTGFWRLPLTGLRLGALMGLEPEGDAPGDAAAPGLEALDLLADQIHRYGGWALQADPLPMDLVERVLAGKCDFCREDQTEALARQALASGNPGPLAELCGRWLAQGLEARRLARGFNAAQAPLGEGGERGGGILLAIRLGLPGLAFLSPRDLGPRGDDGAFAAGEGGLRGLLESRSAAGLAEGSLAKAERSGGILALLSALPDNGFWLALANFSPARGKISIALPRRCKRAADAATGADLAAHLEDDGQKFAMPLDGHEARHVIFHMD